MTERERFTAWITKYAMTDGILERKVEDCFDISAAMVKDIQTREYSGIYYHGKDWHRTKAEAIKRAKEMQVAKLKLIDQQRKRIAAFRFEEIDTND